MEGLILATMANGNKVVRIVEGLVFANNGKRKDQCRLCGGSTLCNHGKRKAVCIKCGGSEFCNHSQQTHLCAECNNFVCTLDGCGMVGNKFAGVVSLQCHMRNFHSNNPKALTKQKELVVHTAYQSWHPIRLSIPYAL